MEDFNYIDFFRDNLVLIGAVALVIFGYFLLLVRKRRQQDFLHNKRDEKKSQ